ncbi:hypothetical protein H696_03799 [Fonticula alba]|uniref:Uncharacterized protein n=1 Tax=Fonticula alba TaxID=691883 RepID=A0A058Z5G5_FONAL|nr:hypothetical protein H696_03799 [Fonticula alba]KCV69366.1 hypothetical protein H696_03799 [Fonticula alba]|eukprot:XP_009495931.1 hypothetical protein H696_03799 [Fonticula alba]
MARRHFPGQGDRRGKGRVQMQGISRQERGHNLLIDRQKKAHVLVRQLRHHPAQSRQTLHAGPLLALHQAIGHTCLVDQRVNLLRREAQQPGQQGLRHRRVPGHQSAEIAQKIGHFLIRQDPMPLPGWRYPELHRRKGLHQGLQRYHIHPQQPGHVLLQGLRLGQALKAQEETQAAGGLETTGQRHTSSLHIQAEGLPGVDAHARKSSTGPRDLGVGSRGLEEGWQRKGRAWRVGPLGGDVQGFQSGRERGVELRDGRQEGKRPAGKGPAEEGPDDQV